MASSFTAMFGNMDTYGLPDHLIEHVAKHYHMSEFKKIQSQIHSNYSEFEKIFMEYSELGAIPLVTHLKERYSDFKIHIDMYNTDSHWITIIFKLTNTKFVLFHEHQYGGRDQRFFMEGEVLRKKVYMTRFYHINLRHKISFYNIRDYFYGKSGLTLIPFAFLKEVMPSKFSVVPEYFTKTFHNSPQIKRSIFSKNIIDWFLRNKNLLLKYYHEHRDGTNII
jgi:hypothetical protein